MLLQLKWPEAYKLDHYALDKLNTFACDAEPTRVLFVKRNIRIDALIASCGDNVDHIMVTARTVVDESSVLLPNLRFSCIKIDDIVTWAMRVILWHAGVKLQFVNCEAIFALNMITSLLSFRLFAICDGKCGRWMRWWLVVLPLMLFSAEPSNSTAIPVILHTVSSHCYESNEKEKTRYICARVTRWLI